MTDKDLENRRINVNEIQVKSSIPKKKEKMRIAFGGWIQEKNSYRYINYTGVLLSGKAKGLGSRKRSKAYCTNMKLIDVYQKKAL